MSLLRVRLLDRYFTGTPFGRVRPPSTISRVRTDSNLTNVLFYPRGRLSRPSPLPLSVPWSRSSRSGRPYPPLCTEPTAHWRPPNTRPYATQDGLRRFSSRPTRSLRNLLTYLVLPEVLPVNPWSGPAISPTHPTLSLLLVWPSPESPVRGRLGPTLHPPSPSLSLGPYTGLKSKFPIYHPCIKWLDLFPLPPYLIRTLL